jgi:hypothetical protein
LEVEELRARRPGGNLVPPAAGEVKIRFQAWITTGKFELCA